MNEEPAPEIPKPKRRWKKVCVALGLLLVVAAGIIWLLLPPEEPSYNGQPLSYWLARYAETGFVSEDTTDPKAIESRDAIRHIGTNAIPALLRLLRAKDSDLKLKLVELSERQDYVHFNFSSAPELNTRAALGFYCLGELAAGSIPAIVDVYSNSPSEYSRNSANSALLALYPAPAAAVPYWIPPPQQAQWYCDAGQLKTQTGAYSNAILAFSAAIKLDPINVPAYADRAAAKIQLQDFTGALADAQKATELQTKNERGFSLVGLCEFALRNYADADIAFTTAIKLNTNNVESYNYRGLVRANLRKLDDALIDFNKAAEIFPGDPAAWRNRAMVENIHKDYELALTDVSKSIDLGDKNARAYATRARIKDSLKEYEAASADFDRAIELDPKDFNTYASRGLNRVYLGNFDGANADIDKALQINPKALTAYLARGFLKGKRGDAGALVEFQAAVDLGLMAPETHAMLGLFQYRFSKRTAALENCRQALKMGMLGGTEDLRAYIWLMRAQSGETAEANRELETFLKSLPAAKTNDWEASIARFFCGSSTESNFLAEATTTAKRPSAIKTQVCESFYYAGMKRKLGGDLPGVAALFQKSVDTGINNNLSYMNATAEIKTLKNQ